jgi:uncharacterized protein
VTVLQRRISVPFRIEDGSVVTVVGRDNIVREAIFSLVMTKVGERVMEPSYGSNVHQSLWEGQDSTAVAVLLADIRSMIERGFPDVSAPVVEVDQTSLEEGTLAIIIEYFTDGSSVPTSLTVPVSELLVED